LAGLLFAGLSFYTVRKLVQRHRLTRESRVVRVTPTEPRGPGETVASPCRIIKGLYHGD
jgi:hypothetical protein